MVKYTVKNITRGVLNIDLGTISEGRRDYIRLLPNERRDVSFLVYDCKYVQMAIRNKKLAVETSNSDDVFGII